MIEFFAIGTAVLPIDGMAEADRIPKAGMHEGLLPWMPGKMEKSWRGGGRVLLSTPLG